VGSPPLRAYTQQPRLTGRRSNCRGRPGTDSITAPRGPLAQISILEEENTRNAKKIMQFFRGCIWCCVAMPLFYGRGLVLECIAPDINPTNPRFGREFLRRSRESPIDTNSPSLYPALDVNVMLIPLIYNHQSIAF